MRRSQGWVYAIESPVLNLVKIGYAGLDEGRRGRYREAELWHPLPLMVHSESFHEFALAAEKALHKELSEGRWREFDEWFRLDHPAVQSVLAKRLDVEMGVGLPIRTRIEQLNREPRVVA
jgi:hypothetical protein